MNSKLTNKSKYIIIAIILIFGIGAGALGYFRNKKAISPIASVSSITSVSPATSLNPASNPALTTPPEVWETYTSPKLGFSIKYPQIVYGVYRCSPNKPFYVPLKVFEDSINGIVYIAEEYFYDNWDSESQSNTGTCRKITYSLESLKKARENIVAVNDKVSVNANPFLTRVFVIKNINSDAGLNKFIKDNYGSGCFAGEKNPWKYQGGVYEITIKGEDWEKTDLGTTTCPWNYSNKILYAPPKNKAISVVLGQECGFGTDPALQSYECYDEKIINSFQFK